MIQCNRCPVSFQVHFLTWLQNTFEYTHKYVYIYIPIYIHITHTNLYLHTYLYLYVYTHICIYTHAHTHTYICMHTDVSIYHIIQRVWCIRCPVSYYFKCIPSHTKYMLKHIHTHMYMYEYICTYDTDIYIII